MRVCVAFLGYSLCSASWKKLLVCNSLYMTNFAAQLFLGEVQFCGMVDCYIFGDASDSPCYWYERRFSNDVVFFSFFVCRWYGCRFGWIYCALTIVCFECTSWLCRRDCFRCCGAVVYCQWVRTFDGIYSLDLYEWKHEHDRLCGGADGKFRLVGSWSRGVWCSSCSRQVSWCLSELL